MDSTLLQLFTAEEILLRLAQKEKSGALHAFTSKESANIFFQKGLIVGVVKGLVEGEEVLTQILEWDEPKFFWQGDMTSAAPLAKPMELAFSDFLERRKTRTTPQVQIGGKKLTQTPAPAAAVPAPLAEAAAETAPPLPEEKEAAPAAVPAPKAGIQIPAFSAIPAKAVRTGKMEDGQPTAYAHNDLTSTKLIDTGNNIRASHEEALLKKHPLMLVGTEGDFIGLHLRLAQLSSLIGRNPACDFALDHTSVSRQHCLLQITDRGLHVKDLGTTNGTKVNGIVLTEGYINVGDTLSMGKLSFVLDRDSAE